MQRIEHYELTTNSDVFALNSLQKAMMLRPCWPNAGPTGGEGFAAPAGMTMRIFARIARDMQENLPSIVINSSEVLYILGTIILHLQLGKYSVKEPFDSPFLSANDIFAQ